MSLKICHFLPDAGPSLGGLYTAVRSIMAAQEVSADIKPVLAERVKEISTDTQLLHLHGLWRPELHLACQWAQRSGVPYVVSPHGMLMEPALRIKWLKKRLARALYVDADLKRGARLVFASATEQTSSPRIGDVEGVVIPHPVSVTLSEPVSKERAIGFVGRLHPVKRVDLIIKGFAEYAKSTNNPMRLVLIGEGDASYVAELKALTTRLGVEVLVDFRGYLDGEAKESAIASMQLMLFPSKFENFCMAAVEAMLCGTAVAVGRSLPFGEMPETVRNQLIYCDNIDEIANAIRMAERDEMTEVGALLSDYARQQFAPGVVAKKYEELYKELINNVKHS